MFSLKVSGYFKFVMTMILFFGLVVFAKNALAEQFVVSNVENFPNVVVLDNHFGNFCFAKGFTNKTGGSEIVLHPFSAKRIIANPNKLTKVTHGAKTKLVAAHISPKFSVVAKPVEFQRANKKQVIHTVFLGAFKSFDEAYVNKLKIANAYGITPIVVSTKYPGYTHVILFGGYSNRKEAAAAAQMLRLASDNTKGLPLNAIPTFVPKTKILLDILTRKSSVVIHHSTSGLIPVKLNRHYREKDNEKSAAVLAKIQSNSNIIKEETGDDELIYVNLNRNKPQYDNFHFSLIRRN